MERTCLVTVGATVGFEGLTRAVLHPDFWACLRGRGYTQLRVQCGPDIAWATELLSSLEEAIPSGLDVSVFELSRNLMKEEMSRCRAIKGRCAQGLIISHAGS
jgi:beta-1,4-N-acetylglucosaminyltransferase